jgi:hypothetical protein
MTSITEQFPALKDLPEFCEFVAAVRVKEKEKGMSMRKMRIWLGENQLPMKTVRDKTVRVRRSPLSVAAERHYMQKLLQPWKAL